MITASLNKVFISGVNFLGSCESFSSSQNTILSNVGQNKGGKTHHPLIIMFEEREHWTLCLRSLHVCPHLLKVLSLLSKDVN